MIDFFEPTDPFGGQIQRLVAEAQQGGGDVFEIARTCRAIEPGDTAGWERAWLDLAERTQADAKQSLRDGNQRTAMNAYFHANQYFRQSDVFLQEPDDKRERFLKAQKCFRAGAELHPTPIEVIEIRCGDDVYDGYFCAPADPAPGRWPAVFLLGGADAYAEEIFFSGRQILNRGWALLLVDTPGRGSASYVKGIPTRPDYEVPAKVCIDYLDGRPEVDSSRMAMIGISMAGYYAPRAAAFDKRIKALIGWCGCYSLLDDLYMFYDPLKPTLQRILGGVDDAEAKRRLKDFTLKGLGKNITCPTLITHGVEDRLMNVEGAQKLFDEIAARDKTLKLWDRTTGGAGHCNYDNWGVAIPFMLDWLAKRL